MVNKNLWIHERSERKNLIIWKNGYCNVTEVAVAKKPANNKIFVSFLLWFFFPSPFKYSFFSLHQKWMQNFYRFDNNRNHVNGFFLLGCFLLSLNIYRKQYSLLFGYIKIVIVIRWYNKKAKGKNEIKGDCVCGCTIILEEERGKNHTKTYDLLSVDVEL